VTSDEPRVETVKELAGKVGVSDRQIRGLIERGLLEHIRTASRVYVPVGAWAKYVAENTVRSCPDETKGLASGGSPSAAVTTSAGPSEGARASAALALQTAKKLKLRSRCGSGAEPGPPAPVIPLRSS
jgi:hypothetical protein